MKTGLFVGISCLDFTYEQDILPVENMKSQANNLRVCLGGPATNAAITYSLLGGNAILACCIGNSEFGLDIKSRLKKHGIKVIDFMESSDILPSIASISINSKTGTRTIWSAQIKIEAGINIDVIEEYLKQADFCLFDCNQPEISVPILKKAYMLNKEIVLDCGSWKPHSPEFLEKASVAIASANCIPPKEEGNFFDVAKSFGIKDVAVTNGENPINWKTESESGEILPRSVKAIDTLGAGDVFHGAYCYFAFNKNQNFEDALKNACNVATKSVEYCGVSSEML